MSNRSRPASSRKGAPAAALLGGAKQTSKIIEGETVVSEPVEVDKADGDVSVSLDAPAEPTPEPEQAPVRDMTPEDDHKSRQAAYRAHMEAFAAELDAKAAEVAPATAAESDAEELAAQAAADLVAQQEAWLTSYAAAVEADRARSSTIYVVGRRPPRPKWQGVQLNIGDVVPGASEWPRLDSWVRTGIVEPRMLVG